MKRGGTAPGGRRLVGRRLPDGPLARAILAAGALSVAAAACGTGLFVPTGPDPLVYVVLNQTADVDGRTVQRAFLLDADSLHPPYRSAERFDLTRVSDGATFEWRDRGLEGTSPFAPGEQAVPVREGNFQLVSPVGEDGGIAALEPGRTYRLRIETRGRTVTGTATIPGPVHPTVRDSAGRRVLAWPSVPGAAGYTLLIPPEALDLDFEQLRRLRELQGLTRDTSLVLPDFLPPGSSVVVRALDANLMRALEGEIFEEGSSGIGGGRGVFGAQSVATLTL